MLFNQRVPALATGTATYPFGHARAAFGATEHCSELGHGDTLRIKRDSHSPETKSAAPEGAAPFKSGSWIDQPVKAGVTGVAAAVVVVDGAVVVVVVVGDP